jgi:peptide deformylase
MRTIVYSPDPILERTCNIVDQFDSSLLELSEEMIELMYKHKGVGISAPQVGELLRVIAFMPIDTVADYPKPPRILVNPIIYDFSKNFSEEWEGCLSLPGLSVKISRPDWIDVHAQDEYGNEFNERFNFLQSRIIQHEINHLDGILISRYQTYNNIKLLIS